MPDSKQEAVRRALDDDQFLLFYQPIHDLESRRIVSAEALLRAQRRNGEVRNAGALAEAAEEGPHIFRLDSWTVRTAYRDAVRWQAFAPDVHLNVNLSARELQEGRVVERLKELVTACGVDTHKINIEITETSYIEDPEEAMKVLRSLKDLGVQLWLDDFGTGHSSLSHLQHFPIDGLKLPGEFVKDCPGDKRCAAIARSIVNLAHELDLAVIAEGVEHEEQLEFLRELRCESIQGFLFSRPMPVSDFCEELRRDVS